MYREIEIFRVLMQTQSTARAAEKLGISQPAVSQSIKRLEQKAGVDLFSRIRGRLVPNRMAKALMLDVDELFVNMERIEHRLRSLSESTNQMLTIAAFPALGNLFVPRAIARFLHDNGDVSFSLKVLSSKEVYQHVSSGLSDFGLLADEISVTKLEHSTFLDESAVVVMNKDHPLAQKSQITPEDLAKSSLISLSPEDSTQKQLEACMRERGLRLTPRVETPYSITVCELAQQGVGIGLVNPIVAFDFLRMGLVIRPFTVPIRFKAILIFRPENELETNAQRFISALRVQYEHDMRIFKQMADFSS